MPVSLIFFCGPHASGKTYLCEKLSRENSNVLFRTRSTLASLQEIERCGIDTPYLHSDRSIETNPQDLYQMLVAQQKIAHDRSSFILSTIRYFLSEVGNQLSSNERCFIVFDRSVDWVAYTLWITKMSNDARIKDMLAQKFYSICRCLLLSDIVGRAFISGDDSMICLTDHHRMIDSIVLAATMGKRKYLQYRSNLSAEYSNPQKYADLCLCFDAMIEQISKEWSGHSGKRRLVVNVDTESVTISDLYKWIQ